jgi:thiosulfate/3-mercaptopyruvate sulfurtransferase
MTRTTDLIDVADLVRNLDAPTCRVVDCRFDLFDPGKGLADFRAGHIPGAVYADMDHDLAAPITPSSGRHPLPEPAQFVDTLESWGIGDDTYVVAYDYGNGALAARLWWMLRYWFGHTQVSVLDGGIAAWMEAGADVETEVSRYDRRQFTRRQDDAVVATTAEIADRVASGDELSLLDAREPFRFRGEKEPIDTVAGHIPGAVNLPLGRSLGENGRWRDLGPLREIWSDPGSVPAGHTPIAMCGSGVTACHLILSATLAGAPVPRLYVGSWSEWIRDPERPVGTVG